jgi:hypothetical protein
VPLSRTHALCLSYYKTLLLNGNCAVSLKE